MCHRYLRERSEAGDTGTALFWTAVGFAYRHHLLRLLEPAAELASGGGSGIGGGSGQVQPLCRQDPSLEFVHS